jgi:hypothetical protein
LKNNDDGIGELVKYFAVKIDFVLILIRLLLRKQTALV